MRGRCAQCGFDADSVSVPDAVVTLRSFPRRWRALLTLPEGEPDDVLRRRPSPEVWSALEYAAHTRDAIALNGWAMNRTLTEDHPVLAWPGADARDAAADGYDALEPREVVDELASNAERTAARVERTDPGDWRRPATLPPGAGDGQGGEVDALWFLHHAVHEGYHHLRDVERGLKQVRS